MERNEKMKIEYENREKIIPKDIKDIHIDIAKSKTQFKLEIYGIEIIFPYKPYENQLNYMSKVIEACNSNSLGALESPTGTGKTLCLLCASLGWLRHKRMELKEKVRSASPEEAINIAAEVPFIYYTSRTHSQLSNVIKELKKTCYLPRTSTLSSRDQLCVNSAVKKFSGNQLNIKCKQVRLQKQCKYYYGAEKLSPTAYDNYDIEELYSMGQKSGFCPFYFQRNKKDDADLLFLPYNYIFEPKFRKVLKLNLTKAIIIIDEAHNMENVCENSQSFEFSIKMIDDCLNDLKGLRNTLENSEIVLSKDSPLKSVDLANVKDEENILNSIKSYLKSIIIKQGKNWPDYGLKLNSKEFFDIFYEGSKRNDKNQTTLIAKKDDTVNSLTRITPENLPNHIALLKKLDAGIVDEFQKTSILTNYVDILDLVQVLSENYLNFISSKDTNHHNCFINYYKIFVNDVEDYTAGKNNFVSKNVPVNNTKIRTLFLFCFNPGLGFKDVISSGATSVIITSGTLSPIESMESELKCNFKIKLENKHVIDKSQVNFSILCKSFKSKVDFKFDASNRNNTMMVEELGYTISDLCKITPGGILVFFTSYNFMNNCISIWAEKEIVSEIEKNKEIFRDMQDSVKNKIILKNFQESCTINNKTKITNKKGGILFSVMRGTSSEGIDFSDDMARMVIIVGIPYPNLGDVKVNLKREYLDEFNMKYFHQLDKSLNIKKLTSSDWYLQSATRAVNQALGRVIRHVNDYGSMILIDYRYKELLYKKVFSAWLRENAKIWENNSLVTEITNFFSSMKNLIADKKNNILQDIPAAINQSVKVENKNYSHINSTNIKTNTTNININLKRNSEIDNKSENGKKSKREINNATLNFTNNIDYTSLTNHNSQNKFNTSSNNDNYTNSTSSIIDDIKNNLAKINNMNNNISNDINKISTININPSKNKFPQNLNVLKPSYTSTVQPIQHNKSNIYLNSNTNTELDIFDMINSDDLMEIINQNISAFDDDINLKSSNSIENVKSNPTPSSKKKAVPIREYSSEKIGSLNLHTDKINTPAKNEPKEVHSDVVIKKLLDLKNSNKLDELLGKYNIKLAFEDSDSNGFQSKNKIVNKKIECPVCFDNESIEFSAAKCGHILCNGCWDKCLSNKLECPICKKKTRLSTLTKIFI